MTETDEMYSRFLRDRQLNPEPIVEYAIEQARQRGDDSYTYWSEDRGIVTVKGLQSILHDDQDPAVQERASDG